MIVCEETVLDKDDEEEGERGWAASVRATPCPRRNHVAPHSAPTGTTGENIDEREVEEVGQQRERVRETYVTLT